MKSSLHAQASAVDVMAVQARHRGNLKMRPSEWEMMEKRAQCRLQDAIAYGDLAEPFSCFVHRGSGGGSDELTNAADRRFPIGHDCKRLWSVSRYFRQSQPRDSLLGDVDLCAAASSPCRLPDRASRVSPLLFNVRF